MDGNRQKLYKLSQLPPAQTIFANTTQTTTATPSSLPKGDINNNFGRASVGVGVGGNESLSEGFIKTGANKMPSSTSVTLPSSSSSSSTAKLPTNVAQIQIHKSPSVTTPVAHNSNTLPILSSSSNVTTGKSGNPNGNTTNLSSSTSTLPSVNVVKPSDVIFNISNSANSGGNDKKANSKQTAADAAADTEKQTTNNDDTTDNEDDTKAALKSAQKLSDSKNNVNLASNENEIKIVRKSNGKSLFKNLFCCFSATHRNSNSKRNLKNGTLPNTTIPNENYNLDNNNNNNSNPNSNNNNNNNTTSCDTGIINNKDAQANSNLLEINVTSTSNESNKNHETSTANNNKVSINTNNNNNSKDNKNTETSKNNSANTVSINNNNNLNNSLNENTNKINSLTLNSTNVNTTTTNNNNNTVTNNNNNNNTNSNLITSNYVNNIIASVSPNMNTANTSYISANYFSNDMPHFINEKNLLPPVRPSDMDKKCLIIDLDETLVHSSFKQVHNADFVVPVEIDGQIHQVYVLKRPFVDEFLKKMGELYECVLFTASLAKYADPVADRLDKWGVFRARLFREACVYYRGNYVKDLSRLGRDLKKVIILDNSPASYIFHPDNAVSCTSWFEDMHDTELHDLIPYFERLATVDNIYTFLKQSNNSINSSYNHTNSLVNHNHPGLAHNHPYSYIHLHNQSANIYHHLQPTNQQTPQHLPIHQQPSKNSSDRNDDNQQVPNMQSLIYQQQQQQQQQQQNDPTNSSNPLNNLNYILNENKILLSIDLMMATKQQQLNQAQQQHHQHQQQHHHQQQQQQQQQSSSQKQ